MDTLPRALFATLLCLSLGTVPAPETIVPAVLDGLAAARHALGRPPLERRPLLMEAARRRALRVAALPESSRFTLEDPIEADLEAVGVVGTYRARLHLDVQHGAAQPADGVLRRWQDYHTAWEDALDPSMDAIGAAAIRADDGGLVFVAILVEDQVFPQDLVEAERQVSEAVNLLRREHGLSPLAVRDELTLLARGHSRDMAERGFFGHVTPEGIDLAARARRLEIPFHRLAENVARSNGARDPIRTAVDGWMASAGHRRNLLDPTVTRTGVGVARDLEGTLYFTQVFLLPPPGRGENP